MLRSIFAFLVIFLAASRHGIAGQKPALFNKLTSSNALIVSQPVEAEEESDNDDDDENNDDDDNDLTNQDDGDDAPLISANISLATDYIFRGLSQTDHKPAVQGGFDFNHDLAAPFGIYAGVFGSNVHFQDSNATMEFDTSAGVSYLFFDAIKTSLGVLYYTYFGDSARNSWEVPLKLEWKNFTGEADYSPRWAGDGHAWYINLGWSDEIVYEFKLGLSVGYSIFSSPQGRLRSEEVSAPAEDDEEEELAQVNAPVQSPNYFDFRVAVSREFLDLNWEIAGTWINHSEEINGTPGSARAIFTVSRSF